LHGSMCRKQKKAVWGVVFKDVDSPPRSRAVSLLASQSISNGRNPCRSLRAVGHRGRAAVCTALLCRWKLVLPYRGVLSLNGFSFHRLVGKVPHSHRVTPGSCGSAWARGWSSQGRAAASRLPCKAEQLQRLLSFVPVVACVCC